MGEQIGIDSKLLLTESEVMWLCSFGRSTLSKYRKSGELVPVKLGKSTRYRKEDVIAFINQLQ